MIFTELIYVMNGIIVNVVIGGLDLGFKVNIFLLFVCYKNGQTADVSGRFSSTRTAPAKLIFCQAFAESSSHLIDRIISCPRIYPLQTRAEGIRENCGVVSCDAL